MTADDLATAVGTAAERGPIPKGELVRRLEGVVEEAKVFFAPPEGSLKDGAVK